jgi:serine/threonine protein kinase
MLGHHEGADVETGEPVYIRSVAELSSHDAATIRRVRHAIDIARSAAVVNCPTLVQLLDYADRTVDTYGFGDSYDVVTAAWEWGECVLLDELCSGAYVAAELASGVEAGVTYALECLHAAGLVHSDVAPNNIVRVAGVWKLADLDNTVRANEPITGVPAKAYRLDGCGVGDPANRAMDEHGLRVVLERIAAGAS